MSCDFASLQSVQQRTTHTERLYNDPEHPREITVRYARPKALALPSYTDRRLSLAGLTYDTVMQDDHGGLYNSPNETLTNEAWESLTSDHGSIALTKEYAASMGLPPAQSFPWDDSKSIYFINAYHGIHCLKLMRRSLFELRDNLPQSLPLEHTLHCFNALRQDIICAADDTPRKTSFEHPGTIGVGQQRICRSWDQLERWAKERTACWKNINDTESIDTLLRYRYCPKGSPYYEHIHEIFGNFEMGEKASATTWSVCSFA